jgi:hypothetical protein
MTEEGDSFSFRFRETPTGDRLRAVTKEEAQQKKQE